MRLHEPHGSKCRHWFRDRGRLESSLSIRKASGLYVGDAIGFCPVNIKILHNRDAEAWDVKTLHQRLKRETIKLCSGGGLRGFNASDKRAGITPGQRASNACSPTLTAPSNTEHETPSTTETLGQGSLLLSEDCAAPRQLIQTAILSCRHQSARHETTTASFHSDRTSTLASLCARQPAKLQTLDSSPAPPLARRNPMTLLEQLPTVSTARFETLVTYRTQRRNPPDLPLDRRRSKSSPPGDPNGPGERRHDKL